MASSWPGSATSWKSLRRMGTLRYWAAKRQSKRAERFAREWICPTGPKPRTFRKTAFVPEWNGRNGVRPSPSEASPRASSSAIPDRRERGRSPCSRRWRASRFGAQEPRQVRRRSERSRVKHHSLEGLDRSLTQQLGRFASVRGRPPEIRLTARQRVRLEDRLPPIGIRAGAQEIAIVGHQHLAVAQPVL